MTARGAGEAAERPSLSGVGPNVLPVSTAQDVRLGLPARLDGLAPGAELVAALDELSPAALTGEDLAAYVRACARVQNRGTARLLEGMHHLGRAQAGRTERHSALDEFSGDEVAAVLGWSRTMAGRKLDLADDLADRVPAVGEALWAGWLDEPKAQRLCEWTRDLADDHARHVCQVLLPEAPELPVGELIRRIEQVAAALDPQWAERRRKRAEKNARVILSPNPSGTATLSLCDVAAPDGLAMRDRVDALAAAVRALGALLPIGSLRAAVAGRLLDGSMAGLDDRHIALVLASEYHDQQRPEPDEPDGPGDGHDPDDAPGDPGPDDAPDDAPDGDGPDDGGPGGPRDDGPVDPDHDGAAGGGGSADDAGQQGLLDLPDIDADLPPMLDEPEPRPGRVRTGTCEVRLRLTTALGLDQLPGTVPGYGAVLAHDARAMTVRLRGGEWRIVLTDDDGRLQHVLLARRRPGPRDRPDRRSRGDGRCAGIVELQVPTTLLAALRPHEHGDWAPLLAELQRRLADLGTHHGGPPPEDADDLTRRRPRAEVDRWVRVRDRHCVAPGCRRPARHADLDHTVARAHGGPTSTWNLGVWDRHHHRAKHHAGWRVRQPTPGRFTIRTRAGVHHTTAPKRILESLPEPRPADRPRPLPDDVLRGGSELEDDSGWRQAFLGRTSGHARPALLTSPADLTAGRHAGPWANDDPPPF